VVEGQDWRLAGQERYLQGVTLEWVPYRRWNASWDHDHCSFCWVKFAEAGATSPKVFEPSTPSEARVEGYATVDLPDRPDHYFWICKPCFDDFKDRFGWQVRPPEPTNGT
jgi:hypothetical protein